MNRGAQRYKWNFGQGTMEAEEDGQRVMQVHSMDIPYNADRIQVAELVNSPQMSMMPPRSFGHGQRLSPLPMSPSPSPSPLLMNTFAPPTQMQEEEQMSSPDMKKKKTKKKKKTDSPSNSPKGRGRYACLLHRQKHKRCPPDCPERKPKPMKSGGSAPSSPNPSSPRKTKVQINAIELNSPQEALVAESVNATVIPHTLRPMAYPPSVIPQSGQIMATGPVERIQWEAPPVWEDLSTWHELHPANNWSAWEDLRSSTHWEESKVKVENGKEFDTAQFLIEEKQLQMSDSPEGSELITDVAMTDV